MTKGRILSHEGTAGPQVDVLVLSPSYPSGLYDKKLYLAGGVLAAFECKITLKANHIRETVQHGVEIRRLFPKGKGTPYQELHSPIVYGLLAHAHAWDCPGSTPIENVTKTLLDADQEMVTHPREMLDMVCIANLGTWTASKLVWFGPGMTPWSEEMKEVYGAEGAATTCYVGHTPQPDPRDPSFEQDPDFTPIGSAVVRLFMRLARRDVNLRAIAEYFASVGIVGKGTAVQRLWTQDIYSPEVRNDVCRGRRLVNGDRWNEWSIIF